MAQPNVLLICTDHWPGPLLGTMGHERILTPTLNELANNGVCFTRAYTATPTCIPGAASVDDRHNSQNTRQSGFQ